MAPEQKDFKPDMQTDHYVEQLRKFTHALNKLNADEADPDIGEEEEKLKKILARNIQIIRGILKKTHSDEEIETALNE